MGIGTVRTLVKSMRLAEAMARHEGFYKIGSRANRNNNPGNIEWHPLPHGFAPVHGADHIEVIPRGIDETPRFAHFPDITTGFNAMNALLRTPTYRGKSVRAMLLIYAPPSDGNNVSAYEADVCDFTGATPSTIIDTLI